ncbi:MAG: hypothetical protein NTX50_12370, partial [Candidatus Sumerlaeota bacterium]|nr:hypothetical protein [Candidatus Sumerlaeota bacterium]
CLGAYSLAGRYPRFSAGQPETGAEKTTSSPASTTIIPGDTNHSSTETPEPQAPEPQTYEPQAPAAADETPALLPNEQNDLERYLRSKSTAVLAILFSDIEGYTPLSEKQGEITMSKVREFFSKVTHECAQRDGAGWVVKNMGDSFLCVFAEPSVAVARALEMQEHFRAFRLKDAGASGQANDALRVRMGLDMGQVTLEGSLQMDVFGRHVTRAARVMALAGGGQIYLTRAVFDSAQGWLKEWEERGLKWEDHGAWRIKGFEGPVGIYEAVDTRHAGPRSPLGAVRAGGVEMAGAKGAGTNPQTTNRCSVCQKEYASRLSLAAACEVCGALICQACGRAGNRKRCREHERSAS